MILLKKNYQKFKSKNEYIYFKDNRKIILTIYNIKMNKYNIIQNKQSNSQQ